MSSQDTSMGPFQHMILRTLWDQTHIQMGEAYGTVPMIGPKTPMDPKLRVVFQISQSANILKICFSTQNVPLDVRSEMR